MHEIIGDDIAALFCYCYICSCDFAICAMCSVSSNFSMLSLLVSEFCDCDFGCVSRVSLLISLSVVLVR